MDSKTNPDTSDRDTTEDATFEDKPIWEEAGRWAKGKEQEEQAKEGKEERKEQDKGEEQK